MAKRKWEFVQNPHKNSVKHYEKGAFCRKTIDPDTNNPYNEDIVRWLLTAEMLPAFFFLFAIWMPIFLNATIRHLNDPVTAFGNRRVMCDDDQRLSAFLAESHEDVHDIRFVRRVQ